MSTKDNGAAEAPPIDDVTTNVEDRVELEVADDPDAKLTAALSAAQAEFPPIAKTKTGEVRGNKNGRDYSYTYAYADLGDVLAAVRPVLARHGLAVTQRTNLENALITELKHVGGGRLESLVALGQSSGNPQAFGGALTYLRRYELGALLGVAPEEDTDARDVPVNNGRAAGNAAPAELPQWATTLNDQRVRDELAPPLTAILGEERGRAVYLAVKNSLGGAPAVLAPFMRLILDELVNATPDDLVLRQATEKKRRRDEAAHAEKAAADAAAQADADVAHAAAEAPDEGPYEAAEPEAELTPAQKAHAAAAAATELPAGKTPPPDVSGLTGLEAISAYRDAGCICIDPLETNMDNKDNIDEACPIKGHGIPF